MPVRDSVFEFQADLEMAAKKMDMHLNLMVKSIVFELLKKIVMRTPVDTGRAAGNWSVSQWTPGTEIDEGTGREYAIAKIGKVSFKPAEGVYWIYNNLPYIEVLEFGLYHDKMGPLREGQARKTVGGFSIQAPAGMVRVSLAEMDVEVEQMIRGVAA
jgi:hypothetical protein